jgi:hypothetical protein
LACQQFPFFEQLEETSPQCAVSFRIDWLPDGRLLIASWRESVAYCRKVDAVTF